MKNLIPLLSFCFLNFIATAQKKDCSSVKTGKYELSSPTSGKTIIRRTENSQVEINDSLNIEAIYDLAWIDNCSYELRNRKFIKGKSSSPWNPDYKIIIEIVKIDGNKVSVRSSSNYNERIMERTLTKIE